MSTIKDAFEKKGFQSKNNSREFTKKKGDKFPGFLDFYVDDKKKKLNKDWMDKKCQEWAEKFFNDRLSSSQIRKFYGDVLEMELKAEKQEFEIIVPQIKMLKSKAAYSANPKKSGHIPESFKKFLTEMVDRVNDKKDLKAFKLIFESILGFYYGKGAR